MDSEIPNEVINLNECKCEWCNESSRANGYCNRHYQQIKRWGECRFSRGDKNQYVLYDNYAEIILYDKELKEKSRAVIDLEDVDKCKPYKWTLRDDGYVSSKKNNKSIKLHRFIVNTPDGLHTDHLNRDRLDNRKSNLKICNQQENNINKGRYKTNKTGYTGVSKSGNNMKYTSEIRIKGKLHYLGTFNTFEEAVESRQQAEIKFYGKILEL